ncbi:MAG: ASKHA domain-containing protein [Victivallaceae bacterium]
MHKSITRTGRKLSEVAADENIHFDLRCGGRGICNRCRVILHQGVYRIGDRTVAIGAQPVEANACQTELLSENGWIEIPESTFAVRHGKIAADWVGGELVSRPETVIALDLGTTTVAGVKIRAGEIVGSASAYNHQSRFGDNVVTRINYAGASAKQLGELQKAIIDTVNELLEALDASDAVRIAVSGNTVMTSLFFAIDPSPIGVIPFRPPVRIFPATTAGALHLAARPETPVLAAPAIAGFVGGDLTSGIVITKLQPGEMLIDIGTNCEIILHAGEKMYCTAAAAGPAFEGSSIQCGRRATPGAIDHFSSDWRYSVIGDQAPKGVCGSAMVDILHAGRQAGWLNEFGRLELETLGERRRQCGHIHAVELAPGVVLTEPDIEQLLKAKAAVFAGIQSLLGHCGMSLEQVKQIHLAGGFAKYLDVDNAVAIGMLPVCRYRIAGNTSLAGAAKLATEPETMAEFIRTIDLPEDLPLNVIPEFEFNYIDALLLP